MLYKFNQATEKYVLLKELSDTTFDDNVIAKPLVKNFYKTYTNLTNLTDEYLEEIESE